MEFKNYYQALGVEKTAQSDEIKKAYRKLARKYHPDVSKEPDAQERMRQVNEAYAVLSDPEKRSAYDALGQRHAAGMDFEPPPDWAERYEFSGDDLHGEDFSEFFANLFGRAGRASRGGGARGASMPPMRGEDQHASIEIDLRDAYQGGERSIALRTSRLDDTGRVVADQRTLQVRIPKGVREGQQIRLAGQGGPGFGGGPAGDLYLEVHFSPDARYDVHGQDVTEVVPIAPWEAMLGGRIEVPTPSGRLQVNVPPSSKNGTRLRLKGRGIPGDPPGDLYLKLELVLPPDSAKARELFQTMSRELAFDPRQTMRG
jgi:curved DNA-binding protein